MAVNNFFYDPKYLDFIPTTPNVDLNFIKDLTDTYKENTDKLDAEKQSLLNTLNSLNLHQTFNKDISSYMENVNNRIDEIDRKYQGQLLDRNYQNEIRSLTRNISADENLRYMIKTTEQLNKYEAARQASADYLEFNDPDKLGYEAVLNRAAEDKPLFTYAGIYKDVKPENDLASVAAAVNIDENTILDFEVDADGARTGNIITRDKKTRTQTGINDAMREYMETYRHTSGGMQLQREAEFNGLTYEDVYIKKMNGIAKVLAVEKVKAAVSADNSVQFDIAREKIMADLWSTIEQLKLTQATDMTKYVTELLKIAHNADQFERTLQYQYDELNQRGLQLTFDQYKSLMGSLGNIYNASSNGTTSTRGVGSTGGVSGNSNDYSKSLRISTDVKGHVLPSKGHTSYEELESASKPLLEQNAGIVSTGFGGAQVVGGSNSDLKSLMNAYANGPDEKSKTLAGDAIVSVPVGDRTFQGALREAINLSPALNRYYNNAVKAKQYDDMMYDTKIIAAKKFMDAQGLLTPNGEEALNEYVQQGILYMELDRNGYPQHVALDLGKIKDLPEVKAKIDANLKNKNRQIGISGLIRNDGTEAKVVATTITLGALERIAEGNEPGLIVGGWTEGQRAYLHPDRAKEILHNVRQAEFDKIDIPLFRAARTAIKDAYAEVTGRKGVGGKGLGLNPKGKDPAARVDGEFMTTVNASLSSKELYNLKGIKMTLYNGHLYETTPTGQRANSDPITEIVPNAITISPYGEFVVHYETFTGEEGKRVATGSAFSVEDGNTIESAYFIPLLKEAYGANVGTYAGTRVAEHAAWVANKFPRHRPMTGPVIVQTMHPGVTVTKTVSGSYVVADGAYTREVTTDTDLAIMLSLIDYSKAHTTPQIPGMTLSTPPTYGPALSNIDVGTTIRHGNQIRNNIDLPVFNSGYQVPGVEDALQIIQEMKRSSRTRTPINSNILPAQPQSKSEPTGFIDDKAINRVLSNKAQLLSGLIQVESSNNHSAQNDTPPAPGVNPTYATGRYQFVPSQTWDIIQQAAADLGIKTPLVVWNENTKTVNIDQLEIFRHNPEIQERAMDLLLTRNLKAYNDLDPKYKKALTTLYGTADLQKWVELTHLEGIKGAQTVLDHLVFGEAKTIGVDRWNEYSRKIGRANAKAVPPPTSTVLDLNVKNLAPGTTFQLPDGSTYQKVNPVGVPDDNTDDQRKAQLKELIKPYYTAQATTIFGDQFDQLFTTAVDTVYEKIKPFVSDLTIIDDASLGNITTEIFKVMGDAFTSSSNELSSADPQKSFVTELADIFLTPDFNNDAMNKKVRAVLSQVALAGNQFMTEELLRTVDEKAFSNLGYDKFFKTLYASINKLEQGATTVEEREYISAGKAALSFYLKSLNPRISDYLQGIK